MTMTYTSLKTDIQTWAENTGTDFTNQLDTFIDNTQTKLSRDIDPVGFNENVNSTMVQGDRFVNLPTAVEPMLFNYVEIVVSSNTKYLEMKTLEFIKEYWPDNSLQGEPKYFTNFDDNRIYVAPTPDQNYSCEISYIVQPTAATSVHQENFFTEYCSNALFYAIMKEACMFMKNYTAAQVWEQDYQRAFTDLLNEARRTRQDDMRNNASPAGGDNTLVKGSN